jgi:hypothetical protein
MAAALLSGRDGPTTMDLFRAWLYAEAAVRTAPREPWGYAAHFDVARRWGDHEMIERSLARLRAVAPQHEETRTALALAPRDWSWARALGWLVIGLGCAATAAHAARGWLRRRGRKPALTSAAALVVVLAGWPAAAPAAPGAAAPAATAPATAPPPEAAGDIAGRFPVDDANPAASVPPPDQQDAHPLEFGYLLQNLIARAEGATRRKDHAAAVRYYLALAKAVPSRATAFSRLCESLEAGGRREDAIKACRAATTLEGVTAEDYVRLARLTMAKPALLAPAELAEIDGWIAHLRGQEGAGVFGDHVECELALKMEDVTRLERCTAGLAKQAPGDPKTISFQWALALKQGRRDQAESLIARARQAGVGPDGIDRMLQATQALPGAWALRPLGRWVLLGAALLLGLAALVIVRRRRAGVTKLA